MIITEKTESLLNNFAKNKDMRLQKIEDFARANYIPVMLDQTANLICTMVKLYKPKRILEIGTAIGYSGSIMLLNSEATLVTYEKLQSSFDMAASNFEMMGLSDRVTQKLGDAIDLLQEQEGEFDFIFLDGPKGQYLSYLPYLDKLLAGGGVLVSDNVLFKGMVAEEIPTPKKHRTIKNNLTSFLNELKNNPNYHNSLFNIGDGVMISIKGESI